MVFEAVDLAFDDALTVAIFQRPGNSHEVPMDALDKADQIRQLGLLSVLEPLHQDSLQVDSLLHCARHLDSGSA